MWRSRDSMKGRIYCLPVAGLVRKGVSESQGSALRDHQDNLLITQQTFVEYLLRTKHRARIASFNSNHTLMRRVLFFWVSLPAGKTEAQTMSLAQSHTYTDYWEILPREQAWRGFCLQKTHWLTADGNKTNHQAITIWLRPAECWSQCNVLHRVLTKAAKGRRLRGKGSVKSVTWR